MKIQSLKMAWFALPDDPDGTEFEIKHLRAGEINEIIEKSFVNGYRFEPNSENKLVAVPMFEAKRTLEKKLTMKAAISNWKNVYDGNGVIMECNDENKERLFNELNEIDFTKLLGHVQEWRKVLADAVKDEEETRVKNLSGGQSGCQA